MTTLYSLSFRKGRPAVERTEHVATVDTQQLFRRRAWHNYAGYRIWWLSEDKAWKESLRVLRSMRKTLEERLSHVEKNQKVALKAYEKSLKAKRPAKGRK